MTSAVNASTPKTDSCNSLSTAISDGFGSTDLARGPGLADPLPAIAVGMEPPLN